MERKKKQQHWGQDHWRKDGEDKERERHKKNLSAKKNEMIWTKGEAEKSATTNDYYTFETKLPSFVSSNVTVIVKSNMLCLCASGLIKGHRVWEFYKKWHAACWDREWSLRDCHTSLQNTRFCTKLHDRPQATLSHLLHQLDEMKNSCIRGARGTQPVVRKDGTHKMKWKEMQARIIKKKIIIKQLWVRLWDRSCWAQSNDSKEWSIYTIIVSAHWFELPGKDCLCVSRCSWLAWTSACIYTIHIVRL